MQFTRFFISDGHIAHSDTILTDTLDVDLLHAAMQALQQLQSGAEQISEGLPCTVRLGTSLPLEQWERSVQHHPEMYEGKNAEQVKSELDAWCRQTRFKLIHSGRTQRYLLLREQSQRARAGLRGTLGGMMGNRILREDGPRRVGDTELAGIKSQIAAIEERIWQAAPAVYTATSDFGTDLLGSFEMIQFSAYFAAAMLGAE